MSSRSRRIKGRRSKEDRFTNIVCPTDYEKTKKIIYEDVLYNKDYYTKIISVRHGDVIPECYHKLRDKILFVVRGKIKIFYITPDNKLRSRALLFKDSFRVPPYMKHEIVAVYDSVIYESGVKYFDDDVVRIE